MSIEAHLKELENKHQILKEKLEDSRSHPSIDDLELNELKRQKLQLKDEIARLQTQNQVA